MTDTQKMLQDSVNNIARIINDGDWANGETGDDALSVDGEPMTAFDWLEDVLDVQWVVASDKQTLLGANILVGYGGPNIWVNTLDNVVKGYWGSDKATAHFVSNGELDDALEEWFGC